MKTVLRLLICLLCLVALALPVGRTTTTMIMKLMPDMQRVPRR